MLTLVEVVIAFIANVIADYFSALHLYLAPCTQYLLFHKRGTVHTINVRDI